jgi:hypothetical protein
MSAKPVKVYEPFGANTSTADDFPLWIFSALIYLSVTALAIQRASRWVTTPSPSEFAVRRTR